MSLETRNVPAAVQERLRCPACGEGMTTSADGATCAGGHRYPSRAGYLDFSSAPVDDATARTLDSFGFEWNTFDAIQPEDEGFWRDYFAHVDFDALAGAVAIDVGCGKARYTRLTARHVGTMVALDGSVAVEAAVRNLAGQENAVVVRSDLREMPFAPGSFDLVTCLGVLHHLTDPRAGFDDVAALVAPGGTAVIYLYSRPTDDKIRAAGLRAAAALRRLTLRLPHPLLRLLCWPLAYLLYGGIVAPGAFGDRRGIAPLARLPLTTYRRRPVRALWLDTFDRLSAPIENRYTIDDVAPWFAAAGLEIKAVGTKMMGLTIVATRPGNGGARRARR